MQGVDIAILAEDGAPVGGEADHAALVVAMAQQAARDSGGKARLAVRVLPVDHPAFERLAPTPLSTVCFRAHPDGLDDDEALNSLNETLMNKVNSNGQVFLSHTKLRGRYTIRLTLGNLATKAEHVSTAWEQLQNELARLS